MPSADLPATPPDDPRYAGTEATTGTDETAGQADELALDVVSAANLEATARATSGGIRSANIDLPTDDARPAADADRAGEDVYRAAAEAMLPHQHGDEEHTLEWHACEGCQGPCSCAGVPYPSAAVRAAIDAARAPLLAELAEARAKAVDGGEWGWAYGFIRPADGKFVHHGDENQARALAQIVNLPIHRQRVWLGEVEPVTDDGSGT